MCQNLSRIMAIAFIRGVRIGAKKAFITLQEIAYNVALYSPPTFCNPVVMS